MRPARARSRVVSGPGRRGPRGPGVPHAGNAAPAAPTRPLLWRHLVGSVLRRARLRRGWTLRELAEAARVSVPYLSEIERGRKELSSEILAAICKALGLRLNDLLDEVMRELAGRESETVGAPRASAGRCRLVRERWGVCAGCGRSATGGSDPAVVAMTSSTWP